MQIDILTKNRKSYTFENYTAPHLMAALQKEGAACTWHALSDAAFPRYIERIREEPPDAILSLNDHFPFTTGFSEHLQIPHFLWKKGAFSFCEKWTASHFKIIGCSDRKVSSYFNQLFLPDCFDEDFLSENVEKQFDIVIFGSLLDLERKKETWKELFSPKGVRALESALEHLQENPSLHPIIGCLPFENEDMPLSTMALEIEEFFYAKELLALLPSLRGFKVDIFGPHMGNNWLVKLKERGDFRLHSSLPYAEHFEVLKCSKILISPQPSYVEGSVDWVYPAINAGCFPLLPPNPYLVEIFSEDVFYRGPEELKQKIYKYLQNKKPSLPSIKKKRNWKESAVEIITTLKRFNNCDDENQCDHSYRGEIKAYPSAP